MLRTCGLRRAVLCVIAGHSPARKAEEGGDVLCHPATAQSSPGRQGEVNCPLESCAKNKENTCNFLIYHFLFCLYLRGLTKPFMGKKLYSVIHYF